ncbi:MAG: hypothetical protein ACRDT1_02850, partial [Micromonosporaceae bacterium]
AVISARPPRAFLAGGANLRRLFSDHRAAERSYFTSTGIVPIMHTVVLRRELAQKYPWLANNLRQAFEAARSPAAAELRDSAVCSSSLIWEAAYAEEEAALLGDPFAYGVEANRAALESILRYAGEQGFTSTVLDVSEVFLPSTLTDAKV